MSFPLPGTNLIRNPPCVNTDHVQSFYAGHGGVRLTSEIYNSTKFEIRNPKLETISKFKFLNDQNGVPFSICLEFESFDIRICFGFRASLFGFINISGLFFRYNPCVT